MKDLTREQLEAFYADSLAINATLRGENERLKKHVNDYAQTIEAMKNEQSLIVFDEKDPHRISACVNACAGLHTKIIQTIAAFGGMSQDAAVAAVVHERDAFAREVDEANERVAAITEERDRLSFKLTKIKAAWVAAGCWPDTIEEKQRIGDAINSDPLQQGGATC